MDILKSSPKDSEGAKQAYIPDDQTLHAMYEAAKNDKIQFILHESHRAIVIDVILIIICVVLFATHWRWVRKLSKAEGQ